MHNALQASLQNKLTFGYLLVAMLTLAVSLYIFEEIRVLEQRVLLGERVTELFDTTLEIRRFERNYFLHGQDADRLENVRYIDNLHRLLDTAEADFARLGVSDSVGALSAELTSYAQLMQQYAQTDQHELPSRSVLEGQIRAAGKHIVGVAETAAGSERRQVRQLLRSFRMVLVVTIVTLALLMIGIGQALSRRVVQPLKRLEEGVEAIQQGKRDKLLQPSDDRELVAVANAFNQLMRELEQRQRNVLRTEKLAALGTMLSGVAHELNNPLSNIWSSCQILLEELSDLDTEMQRELLLQIDDQCERARNIVRSLLDFARDQPLRMQPVALRDLVVETLTFLKAEVLADVRIKVEIPADLSLVADRQRLQQVCLNLIKNALHAVGKAGLVTISAHRVAEDAVFPIACPVQGAAVDLLVSDSGLGISAEILPRIFDPFFTTKDVGQGMGLGLFIVREIIEQHAGCIAVESEPGRITTFHIRLPQTSAALAENP